MATRPEPSVPRIVGLGSRRNSGGSVSPPPPVSDAAAVASLRASGSSGLYSSGTFALDDDDPILDITCFNLTDREQRGTFVHRLHDLCQAAGPATVRRELLPMLSQLLNYEDATMAVAQALADVVGYGGGMKHISAFVPLIEALLVNVDPLVAAEAVDSVRMLISRDDDCDGENTEQHLLPLIARLSISRWHGGRCAAVQLLPDAHRVARDPIRREAAKEHFAAACNDRVDAVRRAAASTVSRWSAVLQPHDFDDFAMPFVRTFAGDAYLDGIRLAIVPQIVEICRVLPREQTEASMLPLIGELVDDRSWRVRFVVAKHIGSFVSHCTPSALRLVPAVVKLAHDEEREVRSVTALQLEVICSALPTATVEEHFIAAVVDLAKDDEVVVKAAIAKTICQVSRCCGRAEAQQRLLPSIVQLLHDRAERVRCNLLEHIPLLAAGLDSRDVLSMLVEELVQAIKSPRWRVREAVAIALRQFLLHLTQTTFEPLLPAIEVLVVDDVHAVRTATIGTITVVAQHFGSPWSAQLLQALHKLLADGESYDRRCLFFQCVQGLFPRIDANDMSDELRDMLAAAIKRGATDAVSNVRQTLAKTLLNLRLAKSPLLVAERESAMEILQRDQNVLVREASMPKDTEEPF